MLIDRDEADRWARRAFAAGLCVGGSIAVAVLIVLAVLSRNG